MTISVDFDASASSGGNGEPIISYYWDFGDGTAGSGITPSHLYPSEANYNVSLTITNSCGRSTTFTDCLRPTSELPELCSWIDTKGGPTTITITDIFELIDSFLFSLPPTGYTFIPSIQQIFGTIDYFLGFNGDPSTGCNYYI